MRQRRTTVPPTLAASRASASTRKKLIAREKKTEKRSDKKGTALDNRFHRTRKKLIAREKKTEKRSDKKGTALDNRFHRTQRLALLEQPAAEAAAPMPLGSEANGRLLFFGEQPLVNGGSPCFACHAAGARGGNLAADLTSVQARLGPGTLVAATVKPPFPMMKAAYAKHPVAEEEALDLAAFLTSFAKGKQQPAQPLPARSLPLNLGALAFAAVIFAAVTLLFRSRRAGVRSRLVRNSERGTP
ncbi:MAG: hypothetical protein WC538_03605 [Thermoanaerobaculia bacterium]|jgi:hypothetical protein